SVTSCAISADNKRIVSGSGDKTLKVWDMESGNCLMTLDGHSGSVTSCAISADNKRIVSGSGDKTLKVWDMESGNCLMTLDGHSGSVTSCAISADNKRIVSGSNDNTLKVWDMESGNCLMTLANPPNNETASWDEQQQNVLFLSDNAWRWVGLSAGIRRLPIELLDAKLPC
ncbi:MAG: WD40 repeat domain-containing protein, partial [Chlorobiaceae bacterium]